MTNVTLRQTTIIAIQHNVSLDQHRDKSKYHSINTALQAPCMGVRVRACVRACVRVHRYYSSWPGSLDSNLTFNLINQDIDSVLDRELHDSKGLITLLLPWAIHNSQTQRISWTSLL